MRVVMWVVGPCASLASPAPGRTWIGRDAHARSTPRRPPRHCARRAAHARSARKAHHASSGRASCCGDGFFLLPFPDAGAPRAAARDPAVRARCAMCARTWSGAARCAGGWGSPLAPLSAARGAPAAAALFAFSTRPGGGKMTMPTQADEMPTQADEMPTQADDPVLRPPPSHPKGPGAEIAPIASQCRPVCTRSLRATLSRRPLAPPARAVHSRRPFALPARATRSRRPLTLQPAFTGAGPSWSVSASQYRPICTPSLRATLSRRPLAPPACAVHSRRPFALPARTARSRRPLTPQPAFTGAGPS